MKHLIFILLFSVFFTSSAQAQENDAQETYLSISVPLSSGLAVASYKHYRIKHDSLFVVHQPALAGPENYELEETHAIAKSDLVKLDDLLAQTDSLGHHSAGLIVMGWPRFFIHAKYKGKMLDGFVANCYREHIYVFVDWLNAVYPEGEVIHYDKDALINQEREEEVEWERELDRINSKGKRRDSKRK